MPLKEHCLIIGGTGGMGKQTALFFARKGFVVSVVGQRKAFPVDAELSSFIGYFPVDITEPEPLPGILDSIVHQAGPLNHIFFFQRFRGEKGDWKKEIDISLTATKNIIEYLSDKFSDTGEKNIIMVSSVASEFIAQEQGLGYHVVKAGLLQLTRYYAVLLGKRRIRVNCISPAVVLKEESRAFYRDNKNLTDLYESITPLGRMGTPEDIIHLAEFLISEKASFLTGQNIVVDGGLTLQMQASLCVETCIK